MQSVPSATLSAGVGLAGDKHASPASTRQVLLADKEALDRLNLESGVIKENVGKVTGNRKTQVSGKLDQAKGAIEKGIGKAKDSLR